MRADGNCRSCDAPIRWAIAMPKGKRMPIDPIAVSDGNVWVDHYEGGTPVVKVALTGGDVPLSIPLRYVSHFVTCPDSGSWRKR